MISMVCLISFLSLLPHVSLSLSLILTQSFSVSLSLSLVLSLSPTHLSYCPRSVGIHCGIWTPGVRKQPWYLILNVLNICFSVYWFDFNTLLKAETFQQSYFFYTYEKKNNNKGTKLQGCL